MGNNWAETVWKLTNQTSYESRSYFESIKGLVNNVLLCGCSSNTSISALACLPERENVWECLRGRMSAWEGGWPPWRCSCLGLPTLTWTKSSWPPSSQPDDEMMVILMDIVKIVFLDWPEWWHFNLFHVVMNHFPELTGPYILSQDHKKRCFGR